MRVETDKPKIIRDTNNMALLETDVAKKNDYLAKKRMLQENRDNKEKINNLEQQIAELKELLTKVLNK